jgi:hypothetical protein
MRSRPQQVGNGLDEQLPKVYCGGRTGAQPGILRFCNRPFVYFTSNQCIEQISSSYCRFA